VEDIERSLFHILSWKFPEGTPKIIEEAQSWLPASEHRSEARDFRTGSRLASHWAAVSDI